MQSTALGYSSDAAGAASTALSGYSSAWTTGGTALGYGAVAGSGPSDTTTGQTAVGAFAAAAGDQSTAVGTGATATGSNSVALGADSVANRPDSVSVGNAAYGLDRQVTNVAAGTQTTDAANVGQVDQAQAQAINTSESYTNTAIAPLDGQISALGLAVSQLSNRLNGLGASEQAAAQMAMACGNDRNCISAGWGDQSGQGAVALGFRHSVAGGRAAWTAGVSSSDAGTSVGVGFSINLH